MKMLLTFPNRRHIVQRFLTQCFLIAVFMIVATGVDAETLCYRTGSHTSGNDNVVRIFKGSSCAKGYRRVARSVLGANVVTGNMTGAQGTQGPEGDRGVEGSVGIQGIPGAKGNMGASGAQGDQGQQGPKGPAGTTGPQGAVGPKGADGLIGFNFHGSTGASTVIANDGTADFWSIGDVDGPSTSKGNTDSEISTLLGNACSKGEVTLVVASAPGLGKSWRASIGILLPNGFFYARDADCTISDSAQSCAAIIQTTDVPQLPAVAGISFGITPHGSPTPVRAAWNVRCVSY